MPPLSRCTPDATADRQPRRGDWRAERGCGVDSSVAALCGRYVTVIHDDRCGFDDVVSEALSLVRSWPGSHAVGRAVRQESSLHPL